jgi:excinuclease ABC subunit C
MERAAKELEFEKAARIRDKINAVNRLWKDKIVTGKEEDQDVIVSIQKADMLFFKCFSLGMAG